MRGVVEPRGDNKWRVRVFAGREGGKVRWVSRTVKGTKRQAQVALAKLVTEVEAGQATTSHRASVAEQLDRWLAEIEPTRSPYTVKEHRRCIEHDIKPALGAVRLDKLTARQLDGFYHELLTRDLSPAPVRRFHSVLHAALDCAFKWGIIPINPANRATPPGLTRTTVSAPAVRRSAANCGSRGDVAPAGTRRRPGRDGCPPRRAMCPQVVRQHWERRTLTIARSLTEIDGVATEGTDQDSPAARCRPRRGPASALDEASNRPGGLCRDGRDDARA